MTAVTRLPSEMGLAVRDVVMLAEPRPGSREMGTLAAGARVVVIHAGSPDGWRMVGFNGGAVYVPAGAVAVAEEV